MEDIAKIVTGLILTASAAYGAYLRLVETQPDTGIFRTQETKEEIEEAKRRNNIDDDYYNYAFIGHLKTGKSTLINALRGIHYDERKRNMRGANSTVEEQHDPTNSNVHAEHDPKNPAKTGRLHIDNFQYYEFPDTKLDCYVRFYDVPGSGNSTIADYFDKYGLIAFDCLIILVQQTPCMEEIELAKIAQLKKVPICFVRSKCDSDLIQPIFNEDYPPYEWALQEIKRLNQDHAVQLITEFESAFDAELNESNLNNVSYFCISANILRQEIRKDMEIEKRKKANEQNEVNVEEQDDANPGTGFNFQFEEDKFVNFIAEQTGKYRRSANSVVGELSN